VLLYVNLCALVLPRVEVGVVKCLLCVAMVERHNTVVCSFDLASPRITAHDIHEWIFAVLKIPEHCVQMVEIDGFKRHVYIKLTDADSVHALLQDTAGHAGYKYQTGEMTVVHIALAGLGTKRIRVANLPPEASNDTLKAALAPYGKIMNIQNERWSKVHRHPVDNGDRQVTMVLSRYAPSRLTVGGQQVLLSYDGQPPTCYGCGKSGHMYQGCPTRRKVTKTRTSAMAATLASIGTASAAMEESSSHDIVTGNGTVEDEVSAPSTIDNWSVRRNDIAISVAQMETTDPSNTDAQLATLDGTDDVTDTSQCTAEVEPCQRMEMTELQGDFPTYHDGESNTFTTKSRGNSPVRHQEEAAASCEGVDVAMAETDDTPPHNDRDRTPEELRRSPKRNKKMKMDKVGEQQGEGSRSLPRKAPHKSVKG
jgi:hypothetical protein